MKINGYDISGCNARQHAFTPGHLEVNTNSEWITGAVLPYFEVSHVNMKSFTVTLIVKGASREEIIRNRSDLLAKLLDVVDLELDGFSTKFRAIMTKHSESEISMRRWHKLEISFEGYEYGDQISASGTSSVAVNNPGNVVSPCIVELTPTMGVPEIHLTGICRDRFTGEDMPVTIEDLVTGQTVILDGITGLITENGELKEVEAWELPTMNPGANTVTCDSDKIAITIKTLPLYM